MPQMRDDPSARWVYEFDGCSADLQKDRSKVRMPALVESVGTDGRFSGAIRVFPGFADDSIHGVPTSGAGQSVTWELKNIKLAKWVSIVKGNRTTPLRGIAMIADNQAGTAQALYFAYYDHIDASSDVVMLKDNLTLPNAATDSDISANNRYIYLVDKSGVKRAFYWDFPGNSYWQSQSTDQFEERDMGVQVYNVGVTSLNQASAVSSSNSKITKNDYTVGVELLSLKHGLRSKLITSNVRVNGSVAQYIEYGIINVSIPLKIGGASYVFDGSGSAISGTGAVKTSWGIQHWDTIRLYRSQGQPFTAGAGSGDVSIAYDGHILGPLFEEFLVPTRYIIPGTTHEPIPVFSKVLGMVSGNDDLTLDIQNLTIASGRSISDLALANPAIYEYDPILHEVGEVPVASRVFASNRYTIVVAHSTPDGVLNRTVAESAILRYSHLALGERENFPVANIYRPDDMGETFYGFEPAGDFVFAVSNGGITRILQSGTQLAITRLQQGVGGVSRWGQTGIGNTLYVLTKSGFKEIDGNTGSIRNLPAVDRMIFDDRQWQNSLDSVHVKYDAQAGCIVLLNVVENECILLWEATGAVTTLVDCPWSFLVSGPDAKTGGSQRVYFIMSDGRVNCIDAGREMLHHSMCGAGFGESGNGIVASGSTTNIVSTLTRFPASSVGHKIYFLSGALEGQSCTITARVSALEVNVTGLALGPSPGDTFSIAPIVFRVTCPQISGSSQQFSIFERKKVLSIAAAFVDSVQDSSGFCQVGVYRRASKQTGADIQIDESPDQCIGVLTNGHGVELYPYLESLRGDLDFELKALYCRGSLTGSESETRQV